MIDVQPILSAIPPYVDSRDALLILRRAQPIAQRAVDEGGEFIGARQREQVALDIQNAILLYEKRSPIELYPSDGVRTYAFRACRAYNEVLEAKNTSDANTIIRALAESVVEGFEAASDAAAVVADVTGDVLSGAFDFSKLLLGVVGIVAVAYIVGKVK